MKVLLVNYRYFVSGGPERYMFNISEMLEGHGHEVVPFSVRHSRNEHTPWEGYFVPPIASEDAVYFKDQGHSVRSTVRGLQRAFYSGEVHAAVQRLVRDAKPDVALVLQFLRKLGPSVLVALKEAGVPIVARLSDFGMVCPEQHMLRDAGVCRLCVTNGLVSSVRHRCVHGSLPVSAVACASTWFWKWRRYFDLIDYFVAPSSILAEQLKAAGYAPERIMVLPTFVNTDLYAAGGDRRRRIVYVGRLSREKGVHVLLAAYERLVRRQELSDVELVLAGDGQGSYSEEMITRGRAVSPPVSFAGMLDSEAVRSLLSGAMLSAVPSLWYENTPNSILESLAAGTPVAASDLGSMAEMIGGTDAGFLFRPGDPQDLADRLEEVLLEPARLAGMSRAARVLAETRYSPATHFAGLTSVFDAAISGTPPK
jgi:glycosyltransferase involved in cell wall biosynthesis